VYFDTERQKKRSTRKKQKVDFQVQYKHKTDRGRLKVVKETQDKWKKIRHRI